MATLHHDHEGKASVHVKGAPERIIAMCSTQRSPAGGSVPLNVEFWHGAANDIAALGSERSHLRRRAVPPEHSVLDVADLDGQLVLLGLVGIGLTHLDPRQSWLSLNATEQA